MAMSEFLRVSDRIRPCPFCGGEARVFLSEEGGMWDIQCQGCGAMPYLLSPREARHAGLEPRRGAGAAVEPQEGACGGRDGERC